MSRGIADTSVFIARESGRPLAEADLPDELAISVITVGELRAGVLAAGDVEARDRRLATLSEALALEPLPVDQPVAEAWARLRVLLRDMQADARQRLLDSSHGHVACGSCRDPRRGLRRGRRAGDHPGLKHHGMSRGNAFRSWRRGDPVQNSTPRGKGGSMASTRLNKLARSTGSFASNYRPMLRPRSGAISGTPSSAPMARLQTASI